MKQTEIEVEEKEVERVYCDECGDECTDDHRIEPSEVCVSCSSESAFERVAQLATLEPDNDEDEASLGMVLCFTALLPLVLIVILLFVGDDGGPSMESMKLIFMFVVGSISWTSLLFVILVL